MAAEVAQLKEEVAKQIAQIADDRQYALRPTHQAGPDAPSSTQLIC